MAKTRQQVSNEYGIHTNTLRRWLHRAGINLPPRCLIDNKTLSTIYNHFGQP